VYGFCGSGILGLSFYMLTTLHIFEKETYSSFKSVLMTILTGFFVLSQLTPMFMRPIDFCTKFRHYICGLFMNLFLIFMYQILLPIYSFANLHDISWGNRPADGKVSQEVIKQQRKLNCFRWFALFFWCLFNAGIGGGLDYLVQTKEGTIIVSNILFYVIATLLFFRTFFGMIFLV
jgi:hypothetical protein